MGAGILPVSLYKGQVMFLFGKERATGLWSDFGGSTERGETEIQTAVREGSEELNGFYGYGKDLFDKINYSLLNKLYYDKYATYIFRVDYDKSVTNYFNNNNKFAEYYLSNIVSGRKNSLFEKSEIRWFTMEEMRDQKRMFRPFYRSIINILVHDYATLRSNAKNVPVYPDQAYSENVSVVQAS
jgi:8-oxo-dGTP pyrophosphatase MutT (NUDIX family)